METRKSRLFDLEADPVERVDVKAAHPELSARLLGIWSVTWREASEPPKRSSDSGGARMLESLGYLGNAKLGAGGRLAVKVDGG